MRGGGLAGGVRRRPRRARIRAEADVVFGGLAANRAQVSAAADVAFAAVNRAQVTAAGDVVFAYRPRALVAAAADVAFGTGTGLYSNGFRYRRRKQLRQALAAGDPWLIADTFAELKSTANGGKVEHASGYDVRYESPAGTVVPYVAAGHDLTTGQIRHWLRAPASLSWVWQYYGKTGLTATEAAPAAASVDQAGRWHPLDGTDLTGQSRTLTATAVTETSLLALQAGSYNGSTSELGTTSAAWLGGLSGVHVHLVAQGSGGLVLAGPSSAATLGLRTAATGTYGLAANVYVFVLTVALAAGGTASVRLESAANSAGANPVVLDAFWSSGKLPELWIDGVKSVPSWVGSVIGSVATANAVVSGTLVAPGTSGLRFGAGSAGRWTGKIANPEIRTAPASGLIALRAANIRDPDSVYGTGAEDTPTVANQGPVAVPEVNATPLNTAKVVEPLLNDVDPDSDSLTVQAIDTVVGGTAVLASNKVTVTPTAGFKGEASFYATVKDPAGKTSRAKSIIRVGLPSGAVARSWARNVPWLPSSDSDIVLVDVPAGGIAEGSTDGVGQAGKVALLVPPADGIVTGALNFRDTKWAGIIGGGFDFQHAGKSTATSPTGKVLKGGTTLLYNTTAGSVTSNGRPFLFLFNSVMNALATKWGDFLKFGAHGTNRANYCDVYMQRIKVANGHYGFTDSVNGSFDPHTDFAQCSLGNNTHNAYYADDCDIKWGYQTFFQAPQPGNDIIGTLAVLRNIVCRHMPIDADVHANDYHRTYQLATYIYDGLTGYNAGKYVAWTLENCLTFEDPDARVNNGARLPTLSEYFSSAGLTAVVDSVAKTVGYSTAAKSPNTRKPVTGQWEFVTSASDASGGLVGKDYRITSVAQLREITGL